MEKLKQANAELRSRREELEERLGMLGESQHLLRDEARAALDARAKMRGLSHRLQVASSALNAAELRVRRKCGGAWSLGAHAGGLDGMEDPMRPAEGWWRSWEAGGESGFEAAWVGHDGHARPIRWRALPFCLLFAGGALKSAGACAGVGCGVRVSTPSTVSAARAPFPNVDAPRP